ncbi:SET domain-containing protein [Nostoc sp. WHI]|uniref:SET domain-containing protein n=1 Tax=Nostoc sp. WHI TaxID=2650611 RepID=UPI0018C818E5|nr:SET domain-containing protein [Nostoc sp. WHI]MBG1265228.1 SET domain-containing protein [Nostoc sp. WHI]
MDTNNPKICINQCNFGRGVFAKKNIIRGDVILAFAGRIITLEEALRKGEKESNPLQINTTEYIDIEEPGVIVNHSCNPNAGIMNNRVLVALTDIYKDEEILYDYSTTMSENSWTMNCECSSSNCRKIIKDFHYLPTNIKEKYLQLGIVQTFIVREHNEKVKGVYTLKSEMKH